MCSILPVSAAPRSLLIGGELGTTTFADFYAHEPSRYGLSSLLAKNAYREYIQRYSQETQS